MIYSLYALLKVVSGISLHPKLAGQPLATALGGTRSKVETGVLLKLKFKCVIINAVY